MIKNILPFFVFSLCFCSPNLYFLEEDSLENIEKEEKVESFKKDEERLKTYQPVSAQDFNSNRSTLLLNQRTWASLGLGQGKLSFGKSADFNKHSEVSPSVPLVITTTEPTKKNNLLSFSFLTRAKNFAYGLSLDYRKDIQQTLTSVVWGEDGSQQTLSSVTLDSDLLPIHFTGRYYLIDGWRIQPFVGAGLGATYEGNNLAYSDKKYKKSYWLFWSYVLEAGATVCLTDSYSIDVFMQQYSARYRAPEFVDNSSTFKIKSEFSDLSMKVLLNMYF